MSKVYEIGTPDHYDECSRTGDVDCTIWVECPDDCEIQLKSGADPNIYVKEIEVRPTYPGVDIVIKKDGAFSKRLKAALGVVMDLASQNMLEEDDMFDENLNQIAEQQQDDLETVAEFYNAL